jgi:hypothetical protein
MFCTPELVFDGTEGVGYRFHVLPSRTHFRRYRGRQTPFSYFPFPDMLSPVQMALRPVFMYCAPDTFSAVPRAFDPVFMFCTSGLIFGGAEGVGSRFHVLRSKTRFRRFGGC